MSQDPISLQFPVWKRITNGCLSQSLIKTIPGWARGNISRSSPLPCSFPPQLPHPLPLFPKVPRRLYTLLPALFPFLWPCIFSASSGSRTLQPEDHGPCSHWVTPPFRMPANLAFSFYPSRGLFLSTFHVQLMPCQAIPTPYTYLQLPSIWLIFSQLVTFVLMKKKCSSIRRFLLFLFQSIFFSFFSVIRECFSIYIGHKEVLFNSRQLE